MADKFVKKPWGGERWIAYPPEFPYVMKKIFTKAGSRSSLQFHRKKRESNYVLSGTGIVYIAKYVFNSPMGTIINEKDLEKIYIGPESVFHIQPGIVHRIVAIEDLTTIEVSTPEIDDVVRLQDDTGRGNGRIESEHK